MSTCFADRLPAGWASRRAKFVLRRIEQGWSPQCDNAPAETDEWGVLKVGCVNGGRFDADENKRIPLELEPVPELEIRAGDVLMSRANTVELLGSAAYVVATRPRLLLCDKLYRLRYDDAKIDPRYLTWFFNSALTRAQLEPEATGASNSMQNVAQDAIANLVLPVPPLDVQRTIAAYLDRETAKLDAMIGAKRRLVELLEEKRKAVITQAVTRGLDKSITLRDSEVEWIGKIPEHWETRRIAYLFKERDEKCRPELPLLNVSIHDGVAIRELSDDKIEQMAEDLNSYQVAYRGDVAFNKMRMWQGAVGVAPVTGLVSPDYTVAFPLCPMSMGYMERLFRSAAFSAETARHSTGIVWDRLRLYWEGFRNIVVPFPPLHEQNVIADYVAQYVARADGLVRMAKKSIELLQERRRALVSEAVMGKLRILENS